ncbi:MAG: M4 family metallopeptidase [Candidatus Roizmanbacteria bacterium]
MQDSIDLSFQSLPQEQVGSNKIAFVLLGLILVLLIVVSVLFFNSSKEKIDNKPITTESLKLSRFNASIQRGENSISTRFSSKKAIYQSDKKGEEASKDFIQKVVKENPEHFPSGIEKNILFTQVDTGEAYKKINPKLDVQHFYYVQKINDIPVNGSYINVAVSNGSEIAGFDSKLLTNMSMSDATVTAGQAEQIALEEVKKENIGGGAIVKSSVKQILNLKLLGISEDSSNHVVQMIHIVGDDSSKLFDTIYFISLLDGKVIYSQNRVTSLTMNRTVQYGCHTGGANSNKTLICNDKRTESQSAVGDADVDTMFNYLKDNMLFYSQRFNRNSYDDAGAPQIGKVKIPSDFESCPNAFSVNGMIYLCPRMVAVDVVAHEWMHGITYSTANFNPENQPGSLHESFSDISAVMFDNNWTIGENTAVPDIGVRNLVHPENGSQPDRLFSSNYKCATNLNICDKKNDFCYIHHNNTVLTKAFYLMSEGGSFNGCEVQGVGKEKAYNTLYMTVTLGLYGNTSGNLHDVYDQAVIQCNTMYDSATCEKIKVAMQATEMDLQPLGDSVGAKCRSNLVAKYTGPTCKGVSGQNNTNTNTNTNTNPTSGYTIPSPPPVNTTSPTSAQTTSSQSTTTQTNTQTNSTNGTTISTTGSGNYACETPGNPQKPTISSSISNNKVTFKWSTSKSQESYYFRLVLAGKKSGAPDIILDRIKTHSLTFNIAKGASSSCNTDSAMNGSCSLPEGVHSWWVHSFCPDLSASRSTDTISDATGGTIDLKIGVTNTTTSRGIVASPSSTPTPSSGIGQGILKFD